MRRLLVPSFVVFASPAFAHTGVGHAAGFISGLFHPLGGLDHVLAMVGVGLFAALLGGRALWVVPLSFVTMMAVGGAWGMAGANLPLIEFGIGFSVVALGAMMALQWRFPLAIAAVLVGLFAVFHGYAHGAEMPASASGFRYGAGFCLRYRHASLRRHRLRSRARPTCRPSEDAGCASGGRGDGSGRHRNAIGADLALTLVVIQPGEPLPLLSRFA